MILVLLIVTLAMVCIVSEESDDMETENRRREEIERGIFADTITAYDKNTCSYCFNRVYAKSYCGRM